ncbi:MAG: hypothetical protein FJ264_07730 [Planctomycetes bacterium]|nr:hypothetical protein [Planctomycetota bacterium]
MVKGSDSKVFFELFKKPEEKDDSQRGELPPKPEAAEATSQQAAGVPAQQKIRQEPQNIPTNRPTASVSPDTEVKAEPSDPLKWIKNTSTEELSIEKKITEKPQATPAPVASETVPPKRIVVAPPASVPPRNNEIVLRKDEVVLRQETLIIGAIAATFLSIACFFVGHKVGYNKGVTNQAEEWLETIEPKETQHSGIGQSKSVEAPKAKTARDAAPKVEKKSGQEAKLVLQDKSTIKDKWTIRVISYKNSKANVSRAKEIAGLLQESLGYNAFVVNTGQEIFVCVGEFEDWNNTDLANAQKAVANFEYQNKKQFTGCYPVRMR